MLNMYQKGTEDFYLHALPHALLKNNLKLYIQVYTHIHRSEYYSVMGKNEILPFATTWVKLEDIMLSEMLDRKILYITYT